MVEGPDPDEVKKKTDETASVFNCDGYEMFSWILSNSSSFPVE